MAVPDTNTFTLANVCDELSLVGANRNLVQAFAVADPAKFDPAYEGSKNSLLNFRNYGGPSERTAYIMPSPSYVNDGFSCAASWGTNHQVWWMGTATIPNAGDVLHTTSITGPIFVGDDNWYAMALAPSGAGRFTTRIGAAGNAHAGAQMC